MTTQNVYNSFPQNKHYPFKRAVIFVLTCRGISSQISSSSRPSPEKQGCLCRHIALQSFTICLFHHLESQQTLLHHDPTRIECFLGTRLCIASLRTFLLLCYVPMPARRKWCQTEEQRLAAERNEEITRRLEEDSKPPPWTFRIPLFGKDRMY